MSGMVILNSNLCIEVEGLTSTEQENLKKILTSEVWATLEELGDELKQFVKKWDQELSIPDPEKTIRSARLWINEG